MTPAGPPRLAGATVLTAAASALAQAVQLGALVLAARRLGPDAFGVLGFVSATAATAASVTAFAPALDVARRFSLRRFSSLGRPMLEALGFGALALVVLLGARAAGAAPLLTAWPDVIALTVLLAATGAQLVTAHALIGVERFRALGAMRVTGALVAAAGMLAGAWRGSTALAALGLAVGQGTSALVAWYALRDLPSRGDGAAAAEAAAVTETDPVAAPAPQRLAPLMAALLGMPVLWLAQSIVASRADGATEMARIAAVAPLAAAVLFVPSQLGQAWFAALTRAPDVRPTLRRALRVTAVLGGGTGLLLAVTSPWWGHVYGTGFDGLSRVAVPLLVAAGIQGTVAPAVRVLEARGFVGDTVWLNAVLALVVVGGTIAGATWGAAAYAHATAAAFAAHAVLLAWRVRVRLADPSPTAVAR